MGRNGRNGRNRQRIQAQKNNLKDKRLIKILSFFVDWTCDYISYSCCLC